LGGVIWWRSYRSSTLFYTFTAWKPINLFWAWVLGCSIPYAVPFSELDISIPLPDKRPFPPELQSVGDHLKQARLSRNVPIKDVITELGISRETLRGWEINEFEPHVSHYPAIIRFLGYQPHQFDTDTLAWRIKSYRYTYGLTQAGFGALLQTCGPVVYQWETAGRPPIPATLKRILALVGKE
jgi:DNA-binding transcriptional regulator YiaG